MKRSRHLRLSLMAVAVPAALAGCDSPDTGTVLQSVEQCTRPDLHVSEDQCRRAFEKARGDHASIAPRFSSKSQCETEFGQCEPMQNVDFIPSVFLSGTRQLLKCAGPDLHVSEDECLDPDTGETTRKLASGLPRLATRNECEDSYGGACEEVPSAGSTAAYFIPPMAGLLIGYHAAKREGRYYYGYNGSVPLYRTRPGDYLRPDGDYVSNRSGNLRGKIASTSAPARAVTVSRSGFGSSSAARSSFGGGRGGRGG